MKKQVIALVAALALFPGLMGCGRVRYPAYYTLNLPVPPDPPATENVRSSIAVREFQEPAYLRQGPIVYRSTPEQVGFYEYHRWAADPRTLVTNAVIDHLRATHQFATVSAYNGHDNDYVLNGRLDKLEEVDETSGVKVEVAISAQITAKTGATVWSNTVFETKTVSDRNVPGVVAEMNHAAEIAINKLLASIPATMPSQ